MAEAADDVDDAIYGRTVVYDGFQLTVLSAGSHTMPTKKRKGGGTEPTGDFHRFRCRCDKVGRRGCRAFAFNQVEAKNLQSGDTFTFWMCVCCQAATGLRPDIDLLLPGEFTVDGTRYMVRSGSSAMLEAYHRMGALNVRHVNVDGLEEEFGNLLHEGLLDQHRPGTRRGSQHFASGNPVHAKDLLSRVPGIADEFHRCETVGANMTPIAGAIPAFYGPSNKMSYEGLGDVSFDPHGDRIYVGKPEFRTNCMTLERAPDLEPKTTLFQDRDPAGEFPGHHFEIVCFRGTALDMSVDIAGITKPFIQHSVWNAEGTMTITYDWGPRLQAMSDEELANAAIEAFTNDDEPDEEEVEDGEQGQEDGVDADAESGSGELQAEHFVEMK
ncbi:hypothetical protein ACHAXT_003170 [Thalassiosira profunda]